MRWLLIALMWSAGAHALDVVVQGDSNSESPSGVPGVTDPWPDLLQVMLGGSYTVIDEAVSGRRVTPVADGACTPHPVPCTLSGEYTRLNICARYAGPLDPYDDRATMIFMIGTNDLRTPALTANAIWTNVYEAIVNSAYFHENFTVILVTVPPAGGSSGWNGTKQTNLENLNLLMATWVASHPGAVFVDTYSLLDFDGDDTIDAPYNSGDNLHLSQDGHDLVAATVFADFP